ncbi:DNA repair protein SWI5 [Penicillium taxi]|uniref:DNA repair protein SWI5 n=1 Tax=Penicillium taxi TaxID=168475 RepID=UPI002545477D|nr:DNA repair protein SWI5 [Penicillium taxi]KAJ5885060.1 DNA repair protein SWI5 [Penicillium taxi]
MDLSELSGPLVESGTIYISGETLLTSSNEFRAQTLADMKAQIYEVRRTLISMQSSIEEMGVPDTDAKVEVHSYIQMLHEYNVLKDIAWLLIGIITEIEGVPFATVLSRFHAIESVSEQS